MAFNIGGFQHDAVRNELMARVVMGAPACRIVQQPAGNAGQRDFAAVLVLKFVQAALAAAITQGFPFCLVHLRQAFLFPELRGQTGAGQSDRS